MIHGPSIIRLVSAYLSRHPSKRYTKSCAATRAPRESPINHHHQPPSKIPIEPRTSSKPNSSSRARKKKKKKKRSSGFEDRDCSRIRLYIHIYIYTHEGPPFRGRERFTRRRRKKQRGGGGVEGPSHALYGRVERSVAGNLPGEPRTILHKSRDTPPLRNLGELAE